MSLEPPVIHTPKNVVLCEKCCNVMEPSKVRRMSTAVVVLGFCLIIPSFFILGIVLVGSVIGITGSSTFNRSVASDAQSNAIVKLQKIDGVPVSFVELFSTNAQAARRQIDNLPSSARNSVSDVILDYNTHYVGGAAVTGAATVFGGLILIITFVVCLPLLIVGFLLIMKKKVWRCTACGFIFDRA
jgi:hypothetical protein